jgi:hypothetical protein
MAGLLHRTAQPLTLAAFRPWEGSAGAGRVRPANANLVIIFIAEKLSAEECIQLARRRDFPWFEHTPTPCTHFRYPSSCPL